MNVESSNVSTRRQTFPRGVRLALDVGTVRVGLAASDPDGLVATPVATIARSPEPDAVQAVVDEVVERSAVVVYVGLPKHLNGSEGASSADARKFADVLERALERREHSAVELRFLDERMTTVSASAALRAAGRNAKKQRSVIDQAAAVIILQSALDAERATGARAGTALQQRHDGMTPRVKEPNGDGSIHSTP